MNILDMKRKMLPLGNPQGDGGGGGGGPSSTTQTQDLPDWAKPYAQEVLGKGAALSNAPYQAYTGERIAQFTPLQQKAFAGADNMQPSAATGLGAATAATASDRALNTGYNPVNAQNQYQGFDPYQSSQFKNQFQAPGQYEAGQFGADRVQAQGLQNFQMGPAERVSTQSFRQPGAAEAYMSPYMQSVVGAQQREATRASEIQRNQNQAQAVGQGAFGGSRQAIIEAERQRNLGTQLGDIQATGSQAAYQQAQQQFNAEQGYGLQAQQANQGAGLTVGQQNLGANLGIQQLASGQNMQAQLANQQQGIEAQRLAEQSRQFGAGQGLTAAQLQAQYGMSAQQAEEASRQFASSQAAQQAAQNAQYGQAAQQLTEQSNQYGAGLGLQGLQTALTGAGQLGSLGNQQFAQGMDVNKLQAGYGTQQQQQVQNVLGQQYQDFLEQKKFPYQQLEFQSNLLRGTPSGSTQTMYTAAPSFGAQVAGLGTAAYGASKLAKGGAVKNKKSAGLAELALSKI